MKQQFDFFPIKIKKSKAEMKIFPTNHFQALELQNGVDSWQWL